jgi:PAS domain S-box-containing protein
MSLFGAGNAEQNVLAIQIFLIALSAPMLLLGASIDETGHAEKATRDSEDRMALSAASSNTGLWQLERRTGQLWATEHCREMLGFRSQAPITLESIMSAVHPDERKIALESISPAVDSEELSDGEFRITLPDGDTRWLRVRARSQSDENGKTGLIAGVFADVTDRKTMESEASTKQRELAHLTRVSMLGEISGGLAHELTQPLTAILANAQAARMMLANFDKNADQVGQILDDIIAEDYRAGEVIHRLRGLLKKGEARFELVDLNETVDSTLRLLHSELIGHRTKIDSVLMDRLPAVSGDPVQLQQVLLNLILNAVDAMNDLLPSRRLITIRTRTTNGENVEVSVSDRGVGLTHIDQSQLFKPFFTTKERGLGLGLSICLSIVNSHGGTFTLENNPDGGAIATFRLPSQNDVTGAA